jgi:hypothetical protein
VAQFQDKRRPYHFLRGPYKSDRTKGRAIALVVLVTGLGNVEKNCVLHDFCLDLPHESEGGDHQVQLAEKKGCLCLPRESEGDAVNHLKVAEEERQRLPKD